MFEPVLEGRNDGLYDFNGMWLKKMNNQNQCSETTWIAHIFSLFLFPDISETKDPSAGGSNPIPVGYLRGVGHVYRNYRNRATGLGLVATVLGTTTMT